MDFVGKRQKLNNLYKLFKYTFTFFFFFNCQEWNCAKIIENDETKWLGCQTLKTIKIVGKHYVRVCFLKYANDAHFPNKHRYSTHFQWMRLHKIHMNSISLKNMRYFWKNVYFIISFRLVNSYGFRNFKNDEDRKMDILSPLFTNLGIGAQLNRKIKIWNQFLLAWVLKSRFW